MTVDSAIIAAILPRFNRSELFRHKLTFPTDRAILVHAGEPVAQAERKVAPSTLTPDSGNADVGSQEMHSRRRITDR